MNSGAEDMEIDNNNIQPPKLKEEYQKESNNNNMSSSNNSNNDGQEEEPDDVVMEIDGDTNHSMVIDDDDDNDRENAIHQMVLNSITSYSLDCYPYTFSPLLLFTNNGYFDRGYSNYNAVAAFFAPALKGLGGDDGKKGENGTKFPKKEKSKAVRDNNSDGKDGGDNDDTSPSSKSINDDIDAAMDANEQEENVPAAAARKEEDDESSQQYEEDGGVNMLQNVIYDRKNLTYDELYNHIATTQSLVTCCIDAHFTAFQMLNKNTLLYYDPMSPNLRICRDDHAQCCALYLMMKCGYGDNGHIIDNKKYYTSPTSTKLQFNV